MIISMEFASHLQRKILVVEELIGSEVLNTWKRPVDVSLKKLDAAKDLIMILDVLLMIISEEDVSNLSRKELDAPEGFGFQQPSITLPTVDVISLR